MKFVAVHTTQHNKTRHLHTIGKVPICCWQLIFLAVLHLVVRVGEMPCLTNRHNSLPQAFRTSRQVLSNQSIDYLRCIPLPETLCDWTENESDHVDKAFMYSSILILPIKKLLKNRFFYIIQLLSAKKLISKLL